MTEAAVSHLANTKARTLKKIWHLDEYQRQMFLNILRQLKAKYLPKTSMAEDQIVKNL